MEGGSAQIDSGAVLYEVWATDDIETADEEAEWFKLGEIKTTTFFTPSLWGDEHLYFQHGNLSDDFNALGDLLENQAGFQEMQTNYRYNFEKYGNWNNPRFFQVSEASEDDVINGMATLGCPFAFLIDQINAYGPQNPNFVAPRFNFLGF